MKNVELTKCVTRSDPNKAATNNVLFDFFSSNFQMAFSLTA